jgi:HK97 family phage prohead protease
MKKLAQKLLEEKKNKAVEMIGKKIEVQITRKAVSIDEEKKQVTFIMSTSNVDRHGDIIDQDSWILDYFRLSPMFFLNHDSDEFPIGKWVEISIQPDPENPGKNMLVGTAEFRTEFADADRAFKHVVAGDMNAVSVGFIPHIVDYDEVTDAFVLKSCELLECSLVGVPSNRQALVKEKEVKTEDARDNAIESKKLLDEQIKKSENNKVIAHLKAREALNKAIRRMKEF